MSTDLVLTDIIAKANTMSSLLQPHTSEESLCRRPAPLPPFCQKLVVEPPPLLPTLLAAHANPDLALSMSQVYQARAIELRERFEAAMRGACTKILEVPRLHHGAEGEFLKQLVTVFSSIYKKRLNAWIEECIRLYTVQAKNVDRNHTEQSKYFNRDYVPLLEYFFEENPFPSRADKVFLAKKSGMTYKQIHVWFQNRRKRTKKGSKVLRKKPVYDGATLPLDTLCRKMERYIIPRDQQRNPLTECSPHPSNDNTVSENWNVLDNVTAPAHAFPSPYSSVSTLEPFPSGWRIDLPQWPRRPLSCRASPTSAISIDDLVQKFTLLNVRDSMSVQSCGSIDPLHKNAAATFAVTTRPPPAPHPAFIKQASETAFPRRITPFSIVRAPAACQKVFATSDIAAKLVPTAETKRASHSRKILPLPKRYPLSALSIRPGTPDLSDTSRSSSCSLDSTRDLSYFGSSPTPEWSPESPQTEPTPLPEDGYGTSSLLSPFSSLSSNSSTLLHNTRTVIAPTLSKAGYCIGKVFYDSTLLECH